MSNVSNETSTKLLQLMVEFAIQRYLTVEQRSRGFVYDVKVIPYALSSQKPSFKLVVYDDVTDKMLWEFKDCIESASGAVFGSSPLIEFYRSYVVPDVVVEPEVKEPELTGEPDVAVPRARLDLWPADLLPSPESTDDPAPIRQLYMRITAPDGKLLDDAPLSEELELQDGCYGLVDLCEDEFDLDGIGIEVANRIGWNLREQLKKSPTGLASYFGFKAVLVRELIKGSGERTGVSE